MTTFEVETNRLELDDLIVQYPPQSQSNFQTLITAKEEFASLSSGPNEALPTKIGEYFKHQKLTHTFLKNYDNLLIIDETGTGKTASVLGYIEYTINEREKRIENKFDYDEKNAYYEKIIFVGQPLQQIEFSNQLAYKINPARYGPSKEVLEALYKDDKQKDRAIRKSIRDKIKSKYTILSYDNFYNEIKNKINTAYTLDKSRKTNLSDEEILLPIYKEYNNTIFWMDEAHFFVTPDKKAKKFEGYEIIHQLFHNIINSKIILSTATPMINKPSDLITIMNLILPNDGHYPRYFDDENLTDNEKRVLFGDREVVEENFIGQIPDNFDFNNAIIDDIEPFFRGKITYIRAGNIGVEVVNMGEDLIEGEIKGESFIPETKVYISEMSEHQSEAYNSIKKSTGVFNSEKQASNFVFPDGSFGEAGWKKYCTSKVLSSKDDPDQKGGETIYEANQELKKYLKDIEAIREMGCKFATIIESINEMDKGCAFVLSQLVQGSGIGVLSLCFQGQGYTRFSEINSVFTEMDGVRKIRSNFEKKKRYALFDGNTTDKKIIRRILDIMTCEENANGEYIKVLLVSGVGGVGINVSSALQIHMVGPEWNESLMYQAISRALRADAFRFLMKLYPNEKLKVKIFRHAAQPIDNPGIDIYKYYVSEYKDRKNKIILRWMKQCAYGAIINKGRNILVTDEDYSQKCDYQECDYDSYDPEPEEKDYSTYDVVNSDNNLTQIVDIIKEIYYKENSYTLNQIIYIVSKKINPQSTKAIIRSAFIISSLEYVINNKIEIINKYGYKCFLLEDSGNFYLDINYPSVGSNYLMNFYSQNLLLQENKNLEELNLIFNKDIISKQVEDFFIKNIDLNKLDFYSKLQILEKTLSNIYTRSK